MNQREFQEAKDTFQYTRILDSRKPFHKLRKEFVKYFSLDKIAKMKIDEFVQGKQNRESFCYGLERTLDPLGKITGSTCDKFGVYYSDKCKKQVFDQQFSEKLISADFGKLVLHVVIDKAVMRQRAAASLLGA